MVSAVWLNRVVEFELGIHGGLRAAVHEPSKP